MISSYSMAVITLLAMLSVLVSDYAVAGDDYVINIDYSDVVSVYDGDTFYINLPGYPLVFGNRLPVRINGIDTPELRSHCKLAEEKAHERGLAYQAKAILKEILRSSERITIKNIKRGKYFRILGDVYVDGDSVSELMLETPLATIYHGDTKIKSWCR